MPLKDFYYLHFPRCGGGWLACHVGPHGEAPVLARRQKEVRGKPRPNLYWGFHGIALEGQSRVHSLGLTRLNNSSWPWSRGASPGCLVPGPGVLCES